jgi:ketosteroid isomerase-like protein
MQKLIFINKLSGVRAFAFIFIFVSSTNAQSASPIEQNIALLEQLVEEAYNNRNFIVIDEIVSPDYVEYTNGVRATSPKTVKETIMWLMKTAPDFRLTSQDIIAQGDRVVMRWSYSGKNEKFGKQVELDGVFIARFEEGKIVEGWQIFDNLNRFQQLGYTMIAPSSGSEE